MIAKNRSEHILFDRCMTELVKFLSCLMIALHHYSQGMVVAGTHNPIYQLFSTQGGWLGVAIFFFLSGYGLMKSDQKHNLAPIPFFKKRLLKTYLPAVLVSLIWGTYLVIGGGNALSWQWAGGVFWNFNDEVLWFVRAIVKLYAAFYAYSWLAHRWRKGKLISLTVIASLAVWWTGTGFIHGASIVLFFVGMSLVEYDGWWLRTIRKVYPVAVIYVVIIALAVIFRHDAEWIHLLINQFVILSGIVLVATYNIKLPALPRWMGGASYDIYLVHNKTLMLLRPEYIVIPLWMFVGLTIAFTITFYNSRKILINYLHI